MRLGQRIVAGLTEYLRDLRLRRTWKVCKQCGCGVIVRTECPYCALVKTCLKDQEDLANLQDQLDRGVSVAASLWIAAEKVTALITLQVYLKEPSVQMSRLVFNRYDALIEAANELRELLKQTKEKSPCDSQPDGRPDRRS